MRRLRLVLSTAAALTTLASIADAQEDRPLHRFEVGARLGLADDHWGAPDTSTRAGMIGLDARYAIVPYLAAGLTGELTFLPGTSGANLQAGLLAAWLRLPTGKVRPYAHLGLGIVHGSLESSPALGVGAGADWCFGKERDEGECGLSLGPFLAATIATKDADLTLVTYGARVGTAF